VKLAGLSHPGIQASREEVAKSLEGNWRPELLFVLQQEVEMYGTYQPGVELAPHGGLSSLGRLS
jgi:transposase